MSCVSNNNSGLRRPATGFSLLELIVAMTITMIFFGVVYMTFVQVSKGHKTAEARMDAMRNGRAALETLRFELKSSMIKDLSGVNVYFRGIHIVLPYGDGIDNDGDGLIDEEEVNGRLDLPTTSSLASLQRHAQLANNYVERPMQIATTTLGDLHVDVDAKFGRDILILNVTPNPAKVGVDHQQITYAVTQFDGEDNVLVRQSVDVKNDNTTDTNSLIISPLAFKVAGFDLLFWDPNALPANQKWLTDWDSTKSASFDAPQLPLPASVYIRLTMLADPRPTEALVPGKPMDVIPMEMIVNNEDIIGSAEYLAERPNL